MIHNAQKRSKKKVEKYLDYTRNITISYHLNKCSYYICYYIQRVWWKNPHYNRIEENEKIVYYYIRDKIFNQV